MNKELYVQYRRTTDKADDPPNVGKVVGWVAVDGITCAVLMTPHGHFVTQPTTFMRETSYHDWQASGGQ